jgi:CBS domain-containing protein
MSTLLIDAVLRDAGGGHLIVIPAAAVVSEAVALMTLRNVGAVIAMTEDNLVGGIFTERDLLVRVVHPGLDPKSTPLSMVMSRDVKFVSTGTTVEAALALMHVNHYRHLLVIDGPRVHGLVSMRDLSYQMLRHGEGRFEAAVRDAERQPEA